MSCDEGWTADTAVDAAHQNQGYVLFDETEHFLLFQQTTSPSYALFDQGRADTLGDQLECGYRYYVCHLGLLAPATEKIHVYVGDHGSSVLYGTTYLSLSDSLISIPGATDDVLLTTPVHELFHFVQYRSYGFTTTQSLGEGLAALAEQLVSTSNLQASFARTERLTPFQSPNYSPVSEYGFHLFWRYAMEQIAGRRTSLPIAPDEAVAELLEDAIRAALDTPGRATRDVLDTLHYATASLQSADCDPERLLDDYVTMRYAVRHVDPLRQPRYTLLAAGTLLAQADLSLTWTSSGTALAPGDVAGFENASVTYAPFLPFQGYNAFLGTEYHQLLLDPAVTGLVVTDLAPDPDLRHQLIVRYPGSVVARQVLDAGTSETVVLRSPQSVLEVVLASYTVQQDPYDSGVGRVYDVSVEAQ